MLDYVTAKTIKNQEDGSVTYSDVGILRFEKLAYVIYLFLVQFICSDIVFVMSKI
jgi:hypothetical protein